MVARMRNHGGADKNDEAGAIGPCFCLLQLLNDLIQPNRPISSLKRSDQLFRDKTV